MSTDKEPHHRQCPKGPSSHCFYQKALALGKVPPKHIDRPSNSLVSVAVGQKMIPIYRRMSDETLLQRMVHGGTQNANESLNSMIWVRCPKTSFMGLKRVEGSVARAVCIFNQGAAEMLSVMDRINVDACNITLRLLTKKDKKRLRNADAASTARARTVRKARMIQYRKAVRAEESRDGEVYGAGIQ
jgi:hypothetical protein